MPGIYTTQKHVHVPCPKAKPHVSEITKSDKGRRSWNARCAGTFNLAIYYF